MNKKVPSRTSGPEWWVGVEEGATASAEHFNPKANYISVAALLSLWCLAASETFSALILFADARFNYIHASIVGLVINELPDRMVVLTSLRKYHQPFQGRSEDWGAENGKGCTHISSTEVSW